MRYDVQILLLPRDRYWEWLQACRKYVLKFGPNVTPDPGVAARYMAPRQVITFPDFDGAYPEIGSTGAWFERNAPGVRLDPVPVDRPEALAKALKRRVKNDDRYGARERPFHLQWPTDFVVVTQPFGVNPQAYRRYGMPGHEGIDFRALTNTNVYASADGEVYEVFTDPRVHAYGIHVRIRHIDGYKTVYAHLARALVRKGDRVVAGQVIGRADSTGNSSAAHLHLSLKRDGATARKETNYPKDIIDPTPFLVWPSGAQWKTSKSTTSRAGRIGANISRVARLEQAELGAAAAVGASVVLVPAKATAEQLEALRTALPGVRLVARVGSPPPDDARQPAHFIAHTAAEVGALHALGVREFELAPFANEHRAGYGWAWKDGAAFGDWWGGVAARLKEVFPDVRLGYPCLASGGQVVGRQQEALTFLQQSAAAAESAAWIGVACDIAAPNPVLEWCLAELPEKELLVTEVEDSGRGPDPEGRAIRAATFARQLTSAGVTAVLLSLDDLGPGGDSPNWEALQIVAEAAV